MTCVLVVLHVTRGEDVLDGATGTGATRTAGLGHALQGQRDWDMRNWDSGTGTGATGTFCFFCDTNVEKNFFAMVCNNSCY